MEAQSCPLVLFGLQFLPPYPSRIYWLNADSDIKDLNSL